MSYFSLFQSTHPARGATRSGFLTPTVDQFQSTHPARGATFRCLDKKPLFGFQSTHPARGATPRRMVQNRHGAISIHAPREGCDVQIGRRAQDDAKHFNPRTPRGVRLENSPLYQNRVYFNPRTPRGVRLQPGYECKVSDEFQSTHPARGATVLDGVRGRGAPDFNPRTPRGVRPSNRPNQTYSERFQSTHPARGATGA